MAGHAETFCYFRYWMASLNDLAGRFVFELWGVSCITHWTISYAQIILGVVYRSGGSPVANDPAVRTQQWPMASGVIFLF